jgi:hypothetical protein
MRGPNNEPPVFAEALVVCWQHESTTWYYGARPVVSPADLQANEARIRRAFAGVPDETAGTVIELSKPFSAFLDALNEDGIVSNGPGKEDRLTKLLVATMCLLPPHDRKKILITSPRVDLSDTTLWGLDVEGRPDLTQLKQHILKHGGVRFMRNDCLAADVHPEVAVKLLTEGRIYPPKGAKLVKMEMRKCHSNAFKLAALPGVELWTGFALHDDVWTLHSWVLDSNQIIETTSVPDLYYGVHFPTPFSKLVVALGRSRNLKSDKKHGRTPGGGNRDGRRSCQRRHPRNPGQE